MKILRNLLVFMATIFAINTFSQTTTTITTSGSWTVPTGVTSIVVEAWGGGGGGGGGKGATTGSKYGCGGGGGGGAYSRSTLTVTAGNVFTVTIGAGGTAGASTGTNGGNGGTTTFTGTPGTVSAAGGSFGAGAVSTSTTSAFGTGGAGGSSGTGYLYSGGSGCTAYTTYYSGSGGGGAGSGGNGGNATTYTTGGAGGAGTYTGGAGGIGNYVYGAGSTGNAPGGGGGGGVGANGTTLNAYAGGAGGAGQVKVTYTVCTAPAITAQPSNVGGTTCQSGTAFTALSVTATGTTLSYQWQSCTTSGGTYTNITGATSSTYTPPNTTTGTLYYKCYISNACGNATTTASGAYVVNTSPSAVTVATAGTYCTSTTLTASGGTGGTIYWQNTTTGGTSTTTSSSSQSVSSSGTYYFRSYGSGCWSVEGSAAITINTSLSLTSQPSTSNQTKCSGSAFTSISVTVTGTSPSYQWQQSADGSTGWINAVGGTGGTTNTYTPPNSTPGVLYYRCLVTSPSPCSSSITSNVSGSFTVNVAPTISYTGSPFTYSVGTTISTLTPTLGNSPTSFTLSSSLPSGLSMNGSTGVITGTPTVTSASTAYTVTGTSSNGCTGTTNITIGVGPANSTCSNATTLSCGSTSGTTVSTTGSSSGLPIGTTYLSGGLSDYGVWYKVVGDGASYSITFTPSSGYDPEVVVVSGSCGSYTAVTAVDAGASGTAETVTFTASSGTTYYIYIAHYASGNTTTGTFTISTTSTPATPSGISGPAVVCSNSTGTYSVTNVSGLTYNWTLPTGWTGTSTTNSIVVTPGSSPGLIKVSASSSCGTSAQASLSASVSIYPQSVNAGTDASVCLGQSSSLNASSSTGAVTIFNTDCSSGSGWTTNDANRWGISNTSTAGSAATEFRFNYYISTAGINANVAYSNLINTSGYTSVGMSFKHMVDWWSGTFNLYVETSPDNVTWTSRWTIAPTADVAASTVNIDLSTLNGSSFYIRFRFSGNTAKINDWFIDDIAITGTPTLSYSWINTTTGLSATNINNPTASPTTTTTYTVQSSAGGCSNTDDVQITVNQPSASSINTSIGSVLSNGDYVWNGSSDTNWDTSVNWYTYTGSYFTAASSNPTSSSNVYIVPSSVTQCISSANSPILATNDVINNLYIGSSSSLDLSSNTLSVSGNVTSNGLIYGTGTIKLNGTGTQTITGSGNIIFPNMEVDKSSGSITLSVPLTVSNTLTMTNGNINNSSNIIEVGSSTSNLGSINWTSGKISGPLKRWFGTSTNSSQSSGIFPIGNSFLNRYAQINFTSAPTTGGYIIGKYLNGVPSTQNTGLPLTATGQIVDNYEDEGYWELTPYSSSNVSYGALNTATYTVTLRGNTLTTVSDYTLSRIIKAPGSSHTSWEACGTHNGSVGSNSDFNITSTGVTGFSWFNIANPPSTGLPVELISFSVNCESDNVVIDWQTASEHNTSYFTIEISRDGLQWDVIGTVGAAGNSNQLISYSYSDKTMGLSYYRLNQIDLDGVVKHYGPISSNCSSGSYFTTFPNPSGLSFSILINDENLLGECNVVIVDEMGKSVIVKMVDVKSGINLITMDAYDLKPGVYFISISNNNYTTDIIKQSIK